MIVGESSHLGESSPPWEDSKKFVTIKLKGTSPSFWEDSPITYEEKRTNLGGIIKNWLNENLRIAPAGPL